MNSPDSSTRSDRRRERVLDRWYEAVMGLPRYPADTHRPTTVHALNVSRLGAHHEASHHTEHRPESAQARESAVQHDGRGTSRWRKRWCVAIHCASTGKDAVRDVASPRVLRRAANSSAAAVRSFVSPAGARTYGPIQAREQKAEQHLEDRWVLRKRDDGKPRNNTWGLAAGRTFTAEPSRGVGRGYVVVRRPASSGACVSVRRRPRGWCGPGSGRVS